MASGWMAGVASGGLQIITVRKLKDIIPPKKQGTIAEINQGNIIKAMSVYFNRQKRNRNRHTCHLFLTP